jgi:receptor expression-enhancing protein 5/6
MVPQTRGAKFLYDSFLRDFLKKNESKIDAALNDAKRSAATVASEVAGAAAEISSAGLSVAADYARTANGETKKDD